MGDVLHRVITEAEYDGSSGAKVAERKVHQLGVEIDGVFAPFVSKAGEYIDRLVADEKARQEAEQQQTTDTTTTDPNAPQPSPAAQQVNDQAQQPTPADTQGV